MNLNKSNLARSELDLIQILLKHSKIDIHHSEDKEKAINAIQEILHDNNLDAISPNAVLKQLQRVELSSELNEGLHLPSFIISAIAPKNAPFPLHDAARAGNLGAIKELIEGKQYNINTKDDLDSTALHVAALYGHSEVVSYLLENGADINARTYGGVYSQGFTPLELAVMHAPNTAVLETLIQKGALESSKDLMLSLIDTLTKAFETKDNKAFELALSKIELVAKLAPDEAAWVTLIQPETLLSSETLIGFPTLFIFQILSSGIQDPGQYSRFSKTIQQLESTPAMVEAMEGYYLAKDILHAFPSQNEYEISINGFDISIDAEGHTSVFTTQTATNTLILYSHKIPQGYDHAGYNQIQADYKQSNQLPFASIVQYQNLKNTVFHHVTDIFKVSSEAAAKAGLKEVSQKLYSDFEAGKTILLATGWDGHAIDIILDKETNLLIVNNGGQRYEKLPAGINAYDMNYKITPEMIYKILNNEEQFDLEFILFYDLGLSKNSDFSIETDGQIAGNCAWFSQRLAEKSLLMLDIYKSTHDVTLSKELSDIWFNQLDDFHQTRLLKEYLANPTLEPRAMVDVLLSYHSELTTDSEKGRAKLLLDYLTNPDTKDDFNGFYSVRNDAFTPELNHFMKANGYKVEYVNINTLLNAVDQIEHQAKPVKVNTLKLADVLVMDSDNDPLSVLNNAETTKVSDKKLPIMAHEEASPSLAQHNLDSGMDSHKMGIAPILPALHVHEEHPVGMI